jgi:uncharacterized membrane protein YgcG
MRLPERSAKVVLLALVAILTLVPMAGCDETDDATARPAAVTTPTGQVCQPWVNNPHEVDDTGIRACDYPIPQDKPTHSEGMSATDFALLMLLFNNGMGHSDFYFGPSYYRGYIEPAWNRYPGSYYGYGRQPVTRVTNYTTVINHVTTANAVDIKRDKADPKYSTYKTAGGKTYNGTNVPRTAFRSTNVPVNSPAGDAPTGKPTTGRSTTQKPSTGGYTKPSTGSSGGKSGWSGSSGRSSGGSSGKSGGSSGRGGK